MLIYLAARYSRLEELQGYAVDLRAIGHRVEARWLLGDHQIHEGGGQGRECNRVRATRGETLRSRRL